MHQRTLFIFRQDLRLEDNLGLIQALQESKSVLPVFIRDDGCAFPEDDPRFGFIAEALSEIQARIEAEWGRLLVVRGNPEVRIPEIVERYHIDVVYANRSYSPRGNLRDQETIKNLGNIPFILVKDFLLVEPEEVEQRKVFTPFYRLWQKQLGEVRTTPFPIQRKEWIPLLEEDLNNTVESHFPLLSHPYFTQAFGRERLSNFDFRHYDATRNFPALDGTSKLSPYLRFGVFSVRQIYLAARENEISETYISELAWREFWYHIAHYFPRIYDQEFQEKRRHIVWQNDPMLKAKIEWAETGYPLIDAALIELYTTNWMHNRLRMVVASFITKNCLIDWRWGERLFRKYLLDYDETVNCGNWQWSASVGPDPRPLRIFNPCLQSERFDPEAEFVKRHIPILSSVDPKKIHTLDLEGIYSSPMIDQKQSAARARNVYRSENNDA